jgi:thioredoxin 1
MIIINDNDLSSLKDKKSYILYYFTAKWCKPCQQIKPLIQDLSDRSDDEKLTVCMIDIEENDELVKHFKVRSVPTFFIGKDNNVTDECGGGDIKNVHKLLKDNMK